MIKNLNTLQININSIDIDSLSCFILAADDIGGVCLWSTISFQLKYLLKAHNSKINSIKFISTSNYFATGSNDKTIKVWKTFTHSLLYIIKLEDSIHDLILFNTSLYYKCGNAFIGKFDLVNRRAKNLIISKNLNRFICSKVCNILATGCSLGYLEIFNLKTLHRLKLIKSHNQKILVLVFIFIKDI